MDNHIEDLRQEIKNKNHQRLAELQPRAQHAQQLRLAVKADVIKDMKTRVRKEDAAPNEIFRDISSARVDDDQISGTSFGEKKSPTLELP